MERSPRLVPPPIPIPPPSQLFETNDGVTFSTGSAHLYRSVVVSQRHLVTETNRRKEDGSDVDANANANATGTGTVTTSKSFFYSVLFRIDRLYAADKPSRMPCRHKSIDSRRLGPRREWEYRDGREPRVGAERAGPLRSARRSRALALWALRNHALPTAARLPHHSAGGAARPVQVARAVRSSQKARVRNAITNSCVKFVGLRAFLYLIKRRAFLTSCLVP